MVRKKLSKIHLLMNNDDKKDRQKTKHLHVYLNIELSIYLQVLAQTKEHRIRVLTNAKKELYVWRTKVEKIKAIYHTLNMFNFDVSHNSLIAEGWTPVIALEKVQAALEHGKVILTLILSKLLVHKFSSVYVCVCVFLLF